MEKDKKQEEYPVLIAQMGSIHDQRWYIKDELIIGREETCSIVVPDRQISRQHARVWFSKDGVFLEDLQSKNGTHLNGELITSPVQLLDGDAIQVALAQKFVFLSSDATVPLEFDQADSILNQIGNGLALDRNTRSIRVGGLEITPPLSLAQYTLLELLYNEAGKVVTREDLIRAVYGEESVYDISNQALDALVRRLRDRLASLDPDHEYILTVRGHGLRLNNSK
ncbi:MAG: FHA domain-containing protein [Anaerolineales bacterium]|nr:FHA domain-containing protein [Anaerolineales bacterium]